MIAQGLLLVGVAICVAVMDSVSSGFFQQSIFKNLNRQWWDATISYHNKHTFEDWLVGKGVGEKLSKILAEDLLVIFTDAWHFFKFLAMILISIAVGNCETVPSVVYFFCLGISFQLFYSLFRRES